MDALPQLIARFTTRQLVLVAFFAGAASVLAMAPFFLWPVLFVTFPLLAWTLDSICFRETDAEEPLAAFRKRLRHAALIGWAFGYGYFLVSIYWIGYAFYVDAEHNAALMPFAVAALPAGLAFFYAAAAVLVAALWRRGYVRLLALAWAFFCAEAARGYLLTGFPWNLFGEALAATDPHMQMAAYIGVYGLTLAALLIFPAPAAIIAAPQARYVRQWAPLLATLIALAGSYILGSQRLRQEAGEVEGVKLRIVQPNIPQQERWNPENQDAIFKRILSLSRQGAGGEGMSAFTHVIWPESSVPVLFGLNGEIWRKDVREIFAALIPPNTTLILGAERMAGILSVDDRYIINRAYYNSLYVLSEGAQISKIYDKTHLVPFGEYFPFRDALAMVGLRAFSHRVGGFDSGQEQAAPIRTRHAPDFLPLICYEVIFPGRISNLRTRPGWLVNITNDAWFGDSTGPHQHLHQARIRAVEEGLPIIRAANTGISAVIDPFGRVLAKLSLGTTGVIDHGLPRALPATVYEKIRLPIFVFLLLFPLLFYLFIVAFNKSD